jgi:hypothetical protein
LIAENLGLLGRINTYDRKSILATMYFWVLVLMIVSIPLSKYMMSVSQFALSGILILEQIRIERVQSFFRKYNGFVAGLLLLPGCIIWVMQGIAGILRKFLRKDNLPAIVFSSLYVLHLAGLVFTVDFDYALKDLRIKLPLLVLPVILTVSEPLSDKKFRMLMLFFVASVIFGTLVSTGVLLTREVDNLRDISVFISHIRFSLLISLAVFTLAYFTLRRDDYPRLLRLLFLLLTFWLLAYLVLSASITGLVVLMLALFCMAVYYTLKKKNIYSRIAAVALLIVPVIILLYVLGVVSDVFRLNPVDFSKLDKQTASGNYYWHDTTNLQTENGHYVWIYISTDEMREAWNKRSSLDFDGHDNKSQILRFTLIRYLSSKGLRKDAEGVAQLTEQDVALIENGEASVRYHERSGFYIRLYKIIWEVQQYVRTGDPSGHSAMQRIEYWKTSAQIIRNNLLFGVGTGDMNIAFEKQYEIMNSPLKPEYRWRSHNQFFSITVGFGLLGIAWFLLALLYPPLKTHRMNDYFFFSFFVIMVASMISEDTIETQVGVTIFAFFTSLFLFGKKDKNPI